MNQGVIQEIQNKVGKSNNPFKIVIINNVNYSYFKNEGDPEFTFSVGDTIEFNAVQKGKYNNMYDPKVCALSADQIPMTNVDDLEKRDPITDTCNQVKKIAEELKYDLQNLTDAQQKIIVTVLMTVTRNK